MTASTIAARVSVAAWLLTTRVPPSEPRSENRVTHLVALGVGADVADDPRLRHHPSPAIAAATIAICTGVTWVRPWPKEALASSTSPLNGPQSLSTGAVT